MMKPAIIRLPVLIVPALHQQRVTEALTQIKADVRKKNYNRAGPIIRLGMVPNLCQYGPTRGFHGHSVRRILSFSIRKEASYPCQTCAARPLSVCNAIARWRSRNCLAAVAVVTEVPPAGRTFIREGEPADCFFNVTAGQTRQAVQAAAGWAAPDHGICRDRPFPGPCSVGRLRLQR